MIRCAGQSDELEPDSDVLAWWAPLARADGEAIVVCERGYSLERPDPDRLSDALLRIPAYAAVVAVEDSSCSSPGARSLRWRLGRGSTR